MSVKTWREREFDAMGFVAVSPASNVIHMRAEIDELRAALQERDETIKDLQALCRTHEYFLKEAHDELNGKAAK